MDKKQTTQKWKRKNEYNIEKKKKKNRNTQITAGLKGKTNKFFGVDL